MKNRILAGVLAAVLTVGGFSVGGGTLRATAAGANEAPVLSGPTSIQVLKGSTFREKDIMNRVFAMDKEDGDLTGKIKTVSNTVNTAAAGSGVVTYEVSDKDGTKTTFKTQVQVVDAFSADGKKIQKQLYTKAQAPYLNAAGTLRGYEHDRQNLGIYMKSGAVLKIRIANASSYKRPLTLDMLADDSGQDYQGVGTEVWSGYEIPSDGSYLTVTAGAVIQDKEETGEFYYDYDTEDPSKRTNELTDYVPFVRTPEVSGTVRPVIEYYVVGTKMEELTYYHYGDDQAAFLEKWKESGQDYAVVEGETVTFLIPKTDISKLFNASGNSAYCFSTLDGLLDYYKDFQEQYDDYIGLSHHAADPADENVRARYFIKADLHGAGAAYYTPNLYVAQTARSVMGFFCKDWMNLHEIAHGYEGGLARGNMQLVEILNNVLGYYYQPNYLLPGDKGWSELLDLPYSETRYVKERTEETVFNSRSFDGRLYVLINLFNRLGAKESIQKLHHDWRVYAYDIQQKRIAGEKVEEVKTADFIVEHLSDYSKYNLVPYFEASGVTISEETRAKIYQKKYPALNYLGDYFTDDAKRKSASAAIETDNILYAPVTNEELVKTGAKGDLKVEFNIDDIAQIEGKSVRILDGSKEVAQKKIEGASLSFTDLPVGSYEVELPAAKSANYFSHTLGVTITDGKRIDVTAEYEREAVEDDVELQLLGYADAKFASVTTQIGEGKVIIETFGGSPHVLFSEEYASVEIVDASGKTLEKRSFKGNEECGIGKTVIEAPVGSRIRVTHLEMNRFKAYSRYFGGQEYTALLEEDKEEQTPYLEFVITENGLSRVKWTEEYFSSMRKGIYETYAKELDTAMTEEEKTNAGVYAREKMLLKEAVQTLSEAEQEAFKKTYPWVFEQSTEPTPGPDPDPTPGPEPTPENPFTDVPEGIWYYSWVIRANEKGLMTGMRKGIFEPLGQLKRAQFAVILYRIAGNPEDVELQQVFSDVPTNHFAAKAIAWAKQEGITSGYTSDPTKFGPDDALNREQMAAMLFRFAEISEDDPAISGDLGQFADAEQIHNFAKKAIQWCVEKGIIEGITENGQKWMKPEKTTIRAEAAKVGVQYSEL